MAQGARGGPQRAAVFVAGALLVVGCAARLVHLDADPHYYGWWGHIYDEGRWIQQARSLALRGVWSDGGVSPNLMVAPGFELGTYLAFSVAGVSRAVARLLPALSGCALLWLLGIYLRPRASVSGLALGLGLLAMQGDMLVLSRVALPEVPAMLATLAAFATLTAEPPASRRLFAGGVFSALTVGMKVTTLPIVGIFAILSFGLRERATWRMRWRDLGSFAAGVAVVGGLGAVIGFGLLAVEAVDPSLLLRRARLLNEFLGISDAYSIAALPIQGAMAPALNPACLALWIGALAWIAGPPPQEGLRRGLAGSLVWAVLYLGVMAIQAYFPERYMTHVLVPFAVVAALGATHLESVGAAGIVGGIEASTGLRRVLAIGVLLLPTGLLLAPIAAALLATAGMPATSLSSQLCAAAGSCLVLYFSLGSRVAHPKVVSLLVGLPLVYTALWLAFWLLAERPPVFWIQQDFALGALRRVGVVVLAASFTAFGLRWFSGARRGWVTICVAGVWSLLWAVHVAPGLLTPRYSVRDASRTIGAELIGEDRVLQDHAEGMFIDNALPYRWIRPEREPDGSHWSWKRSAEPYLVVALPFRGDEMALMRRFDLVQAFLLHAPASRWTNPEPSPACGNEAGHCVGLFRRKPVPTGSFGELSPLRASGRRWNTEKSP
jgi:hypothetical protein